MLRKKEIFMSLEMMVSSVEDCIKSNMDMIERKVKKIEGKILSLDVDIEETRRVAHFIKKKYS